MHSCLLSGVSVKRLLIGVFIPVVMCATVIFLGLDGCIKDTCEDNKKQFCSLDAEASSQSMDVRTPTY